MLIVDQCEKAGIASKRKAEAKTVLVSYSNVIWQYTISYISMSTIFCSLLAHFNLMHHQSHRLSFYRMLTAVRQIEVQTFPIFDTCTVKSVLNLMCYKCVLTGSEHCMEMV